MFDFKTLNEPYAGGGDVRAGRDSRHGPIVLDAEPSNDRERVGRSLGQAFPIGENHSFTSLLRAIDESEREPA